MVYGEYYPLKDRIRGVSAALEKKRILSDYEVVERKNKWIGRFRTQEKFPLYVDGLDGG